MKKFMFCFFLLGCTSFFQNAEAQNSLVSTWDHRYGGTEGELFSDVILTSDGYFILAGFSESGIGGDKTEACVGSEDYWILKIDSLGNKIWDKTFGGTYTDELHGIVETPDRGFILYGRSSSPAGGDKTQGCQGGDDFWLVKTDSVGNKLWDKTFGGSSYDNPLWVMCTDNGGYLVGGFSSSGADGDKTDPGNGGYDFWILKLDSSGNKIWDNAYGGTDAEVAQACVKTPGGSFLLAGYSKSGISGNKTDTCRGDLDYWILKIDSAGNPLWDKTFGGDHLDNLLSVALADDGGFVMCGISRSQISGEKTQNTWGIQEDAWVVKADSLGNKLWDKDLGGTSLEQSARMRPASDGGFLITSDSYSDQGGDKTENRMGGEQSWFLKIDSAGNKVWDKSRHSIGNMDNHGITIQANENCFLIASTSNAQPGGYKTQTPWGSSDIWVTMFCNTSELQAGFTGYQGVCPGTCTDFFNISVNATSYQWYFEGGFPDSSFQVVPSAVCYANPGTYDVQLVAFDSTTSDTLYLQDYITVFPVTPPQTITQSGDTLFAIPGSADYQWYNDGVTIVGATNEFYVMPAGGNYSVIAWDTNGCYVVANIIGVDIHELLQTGDDITVFPNPVNDELEIKGGDISIRTTKNISVYNLTGEKMFSVCCGNSMDASKSIDCRSLPSGFYFLEILTHEKIYRAKFLKQ